MRIIVISDTHGNAGALQNVVFDRRRDADLFIHLGDGLREAEEVVRMYPEKKFLLVPGNCDFGSVLPREGETEARGKRVYYTHGDLFGVKYGLGRMIAQARLAHADVALYGHTHVPYTSYEDGLYIMNPGSLGHPRDGGPTYGVIDITDAGIVLNVVPAD